MENATISTWYQQGYWPLVGAIAVLLLTNGISVWQLWYQTHKALANELRLKRIEFISQQLAEFYNPIYAMMVSNREVFRNFGPASFPADELYRESAGEHWKLIKEEVILKNNKLIFEVLQEKSHLISEDDDICKYTDLLSHLVMYDIFCRQPTELYKNFQFPAYVFPHLECKREALVQSLNKLKNLD